MLYIKIIAECGCNYKNMEEAKEMIRECKRLNLFLCKFQIFNEDNIKDIEDPKVREFLRSIMLDYDRVKELYDYGKLIGQEVFFTPMFEDAIQWICELDCKYLKVRCKDAYNDKLLDLISAQFEGLIIQSVEEPNCHSTGKWGYYDPSYTLLCVPEYPADIVEYLFWNFDDFNGFSDHTNDLTLFKYFKRYYDKHLKNYRFTFYFEKHVCLTKDCLEKDWSCTFKELEEALKHE